MSWRCWSWFFLSDSDTDDRDHDEEDAAADGSLLPVALKSERRWCCFVLQLSFLQNQVHLNSKLTCWKTFLSESRPIIVYLCQELTQHLTTVTRVLLLILEWCDSGCQGISTNPSRWSYFLWVNWVPTTVWSIYGNILFSWLSNCGWSINVFDTILDLVFILTWSAKLTYAMDKPLESVFFDMKTSRQEEETYKNEWI